MIKDRNGNELAIGDEVVIRGQIVGAPVETPDGVVLKVKWQDEAPVTDYVKSTMVEKAADHADKRGSELTTDN